MLCAIVMMTQLHIQCNQSRNSKWQATITKIMIPDSTLGLLNGAILCPFCTYFHSVLRKRNHVVRIHFLKKGVTVVLGLNLGLNFYQFSFHSSHLLLLRHNLFVLLLNLILVLFFFFFFLVVVVLQDLLSIFFYL